MATYRVKHLYCAGCREFKRCRVEIVGEGMEVYPDCAECGGAVWYESAPPDPQPYAVGEAGPESLPTIAPLADVKEFFDDLGQKQGEMLRQMFGHWLTEKNERQQTEHDAEADDTAKMWREVFDVLTSSE